jgi:hypothetical protein
LLSGKLQNSRKIHLEALLNRTSGFLFQKASPQKSINDDRIRRMGAGQETNGAAQSALSKEGECPLLLEEKQAFTPPSFRTNPKGRVAVVQMSPDCEVQHLWSLFR